MTKTLAVLFILVPITVPTNCAMLDLQILPHVKLHEISNFSPSPSPNLQRSRFQIQRFAVCSCRLEGKFNFDSNWSKDRKFDNLLDSCQVMCWALGFLEKRKEEQSRTIVARCRARRMAHLQHLRCLNVLLVFRWTSRAGICKIKMSCPSLTQWLLSWYSKTAGGLR